MEFNPNDLQAWPKERLAQFLKHLPQIADAMAERVRQDAKHGVQIRPAYEYAMILQEEVGEYQKEVTEGYFDKVEFKPNLRAELVQVAAVALAALFSYDVRQARENHGYTAGYPTPEEKKNLAAWVNEGCPLTPGVLTGYFSPPAAAPCNPDTCPVPCAKAESKPACGLHHCGEPVALKDGRVSIRRCAACGENHEALPLLFEGEDTYAICPVDLTRIYVTQKAE